MADEQKPAGDALSRLDAAIEKAEATTGVSVKRERARVFRKTAEGIAARGGEGSKTASGVAGGQAGGFNMSVLPGNRAVAGYPVTKAELETIGDAQTQTQMFYSLAAFFGSFALSTLLDAVLATELTPAGELLNILGPWLFGILTAAFFVLGYVSNRRRKGLIQDIVSQTNHEGGQ